MIVLNPFLKSLCNFGLKNIGLTPGTGSGCFQSSHDIVIVNGSQCISNSKAKNSYFSHFLEIFWKIPSKGPKKYSNWFFACCPELPEYQKNSCTQMWLINQLYKKMGRKELCLNGLQISLNQFSKADNRC